MELTRAKRRFVIVAGDKRIVEADPIPGGTVLEAKKILSGKHPSITNSSINAPTEKDGFLEYEFSSVAGTKG